MTRTSRFTTFAVGLWTLVACFALAARSEATPTITNISPSFGAAGTSVTIYGSGFGTTGTVTFYNGKSATVAMGGWSSTSIKVTVPTGASTGLVKVTTSGVTGNSPVDFDVLAADTALVLGVFPPQSSTCSFLPSGNNCLTQYQSDVLPNVDGIVVEVQWSSIDLGNTTQTGSGCTSGASSSTCDWSALDNLVTSHYFGGTNWDASKKVGIVLSPVTDGMGSSGVNTSTPAYVFSTTWAGTSAPLDECTCSGASGYNGDGATGTVNTCWNISSTSPATPDYSGYPAVFEEPFQAALQGFYQNAISHLNSLSTATYSSSIAYIRMGLAGGGEAYPFCASNLETLSSVSPHTAAQLKYVWTTYANNMYTAETGFGSLSPIMAAPSGSLSGTIVTNAWADTEATDAIAEKLVLGSEGFQYQDTTTTPCSNDWCTTYAYTPVAPILELQLVDPSVPSEYPCTGAGPYTVGSLACLLPFAAGKANVLELFPQDLFIAYDSNDSNYSTYHTEYADAICTLRGVTCP